MRVQISGQQINIGNALQAYAKEGLFDIVYKYQQKATDINVIFSRNAHEYVCEITLHLSAGLTAAARARSVEIYAAFGSCRNKLEKQLRRYKRRLKDHYRHRTQFVEQAEGSSYNIDTEETVDEAVEDKIKPVIVAENERKLPFFSVGQAVIKMEESDADFFVFRNEVKNNVNVVYKRNDGNIGWIEPQ